MKNTFKFLVEIYSNNDFELFENYLSKYSVVSLLLWYLILYIWLALVRDIRYYIWCLTIKSTEGCYALFWWWDSSSIITRCNFQTLIQFIKSILLINVYDSRYIHTHFDYTLAEYKTILYGSYDWNVAIHCLCDEIGMSTYLTNVRVRHVITNDIGKLCPHQSTKID